MTDREANRFSARAARYARVGANMSGVAARIAGARLFGLTLDRGKNAMDLAAALGGLKGPIMKVAQLMATIPDALPAGICGRADEAAERGAADGLGLRQAAHGGGAGPDWQASSQASSIIRRRRRRSGRCTAPARSFATDGAELACKLQYPDMQSAVEADLRQLQLIFAIHRRMDPVIDTSEIAKEIGARIREELDYQREAKHVAALPQHARRQRPDPRAAGVARALDRPAADARLARGAPAARASRTTIRDAQPPRHRHVHRLVVPVQPLRRDPWRSASRQLHGLRGADGGGRRRHQSARLRLHPHLPAEIRRRRRRSLPRPAQGRRRRIVHAYETWGFEKLSSELIDILNIWARFIYGPLMEDRVRALADGVKPAEYGRREAFRVHQALKQKGPGHGAARIRVHGPRGDRARRRVPASGAELNFYRLFNEAIEDFSVAEVTKRQDAALAAVGLDRLPDPR